MVTQVVQDLSLQEAVSILVRHQNNLRHGVTNEKIQRMRVVEIYVENNGCKEQFPNAPKTCKDYCHQDCLIEAFEATYFRYKYAGST